MDQSLRHLERRASEDPSLIPFYIAKHLQATGQPPLTRYPDIHYHCLTHNWRMHHGHGPYDRDECPQTVWTEGALVTPSGTYGDYVPSDEPCDVVPALNPLSLWVYDAMRPANLFRIKKRQFPEPTSAEELLEGFFDANRGPAYLMFENQIHDYFYGFLGKAVTVIAELNTVFPRRKYPIVPLTWDELVGLTNLRVDLIDEIPNWGESWRRATHFSQNMGFCAENVRPSTILSFSQVQNQSRSPDREYWRVINRRHGITFDEHSKAEVAPVRFVTFG